MTRILDWVHDWLHAANTVGFILMSLCLLAEVIGRDLLRVPTIWTEELAGFLFLWMIFLGAAQAAYLRQHVQVEFLLDHLPPVGANTLRLIIALITWIFAAVLLAGGIQMARLTWDNYSQTVAWLRIGYNYLAVVVAALLMVVSHGRDVAAATRRLLGGSGG